MHIPESDLKTLLRNFHSPWFEKDILDISQLESAQWLPLPARIATKTDNASHWIDSGDIPLTFGTPFYVAFCYTGGGKSSYDGTYELDDIRVFEKATE